MKIPIASVAMILILAIVSISGCANTDATNTPAGENTAVTAPKSSNNTNVTNASEENNAVAPELNLPNSNSKILTWYSGGPIGQFDLSRYAATGTKAPYDCNITKGSPPQGFTIANCIISGKVLALPEGTAEILQPSFTVQINDSSEPTVSTSVDVIVRFVQNDMILKAKSLGICTANEPCSAEIVESVTGGQKPYGFKLDSFANGAPPMGMILDAQNGTLTGTPTLEGEYHFSICAFDQKGTASCSETLVKVGAGASTSEMWAGKMTGTYTIDDFLGGGKYGYDFTVSFTVPKSIIATYNDPESSELRFNLEETSGSIAETTTILQQTDTASHPDQLLVGGSITEPVQVINGAHYDSPHTIQIHSPSGNELIGGYWQRTNLPPLDAHWGDLVLTVTDYTDTTITGTWGTVDYGELKAHGTFTFNKQ